MLKTNASRSVDILSQTEAKIGASQSKNTKSILFGSKNWRFPPSYWKNYLFSEIEHSDDAWLNKITSSFYDKPSNRAANKPKVANR